MKIVDTNVLIYAVDEAATRHERARAWLDETLSSTETVGFAWVVILAFLRLTTNARMFETPLAPAKALDHLDRWLAQPCAVIVDPTDRHRALLRELVTDVGTAGNLTSDVHLAAIAIEHGAELCSADGDFARFPRLRWTNPLAG